MTGAGPSDWWTLQAANDAGLTIPEWEQAQDEDGPEHDPDPS